MATKKEVSELKSCMSELKSTIKELNSTINDIRDTVITSLRNDNQLLQERVRKLEIKLADQSSYVRKENIISGIPCTNKDKELEASVIALLDKVDVSLTKRDIVAVHRTGKEISTG